MTTDSLQAIRTDETIYAARVHITRIGAFLFDRHLTDAGGGNISVRVGDYVCITPRYSGSKHQWQLQPEQVLVADMSMNLLDGEGEISREAKVHFRLHRDYGEHGVSVIHAHPRNLMVFAALSRPMPPVLEATQKFGTLPVVEYAPAHSADLAEHIAGAIQGQEARIRKHAAGAIAPWHGLFVMGRDLNAAFDAVERLDTNAYCILMAQLLGGGDLSGQRAALEAGIARYTE
jgi:L-fuculose-phosphate aldolase